MRILNWKPFGAIVLAVVFSLGGKADVCAQEAGEIAALEYVNGVVGTEFCPGDLLEVRAVCSINNTHPNLPIWFTMRITFDGQSYEEADEDTLQPGDPGELRGNGTMVAPDVDEIGARVNVYWLDQSGSAEPVLRLLSTKRVTFTRADDCVDCAPTGPVLCLPTF